MSAQLAFDLERSPNEHIRKLLRFYGLRTSLIRFKVINALAVAAQDGRAIGVRGVHTYLHASAADLSFIGVREVLKRLCEEGVIVLHTDKSYRFTEQAWAMLMHEWAD
ncbi:fe2+ zn2+ uptake regulation protein [Pseudomonas citri]|uniref:fe2+ zn2+ uptake regulation protein n=1 Tax=Pseudomonas citri TaxID=2978349 RepID=UPI0021B6D686|nr:fe2+ zn2+ uptake regulation protein [Pseudomonas citri]